MTKRYKPDYAKGEILVCYLDNIDTDLGFARTFGKTLGYELADIYEYGDDVFIYKTLSGKENAACKAFISHNKFVDWAEKRDIKIEKRWKSLEQGVEMLTSLNDDAELPDMEYAEKLDKIIAYLKNLQ